MKTPILLVGFNRPDYFQQVFNQVKQIHPEKLYVAIDGPREDVPNEKEKCIQCQNIIHQVNWPCTIQTLFRETNTGCARGVSEAISWAFEKEDQLIILEDDCVPQLSFFTFCEMMLEMYKNDTRVWQVCGRSYHPNTDFFRHSDYIFSQYSHVWGWATWKRCWDKYDLRMSDFPFFLSEGGAMNVSATEKLGIIENQFYKNVYDEIQSVENYHTWDYQWSYLILKNGGLCITPCKNMIHNIGIIGTHTTPNQKPDIKSEEMPLSSIRHPKFVIRNLSYDLYHAYKIVYEYEIKISETNKPSLIRRVHFLFKYYLEKVWERIKILR